MSALPAQLQRDDIVFVAFPYTNDGKQPHIKRWNARCNLLAHDDARLQEAINEGQSIGMVGELGSGIVIFDVDDRDAAEKAGVVDACADTFRFSGYADERKFKAVFNVPDLPECIRDGRGKRTLNGTDIFMPCGVGIAEWSNGAAAEKAGGQCVCPPSMHHSGNPYAVTNDVPIKTVSWADIGRFYPPEKEPKATREDCVEWGHVRAVRHSIVDQLNLTVSMFLMPNNLRRRSNGETEGAHPVHGSETGSNLVISADDQSWYCRRCGTGGGPLEALAVAEGIIACEDSRPGCLSGHWKAIFKALKRRGYDTKKLNAGAVAHGAEVGAVFLEKDDEKEAATETATEKEAVTEESDDEPPTPVDLRRRLTSPQYIRGVTLTPGRLAPENLVRLYHNAVIKTTDAYPDFITAAGIWAVSALISRRAVIEANGRTFQLNTWFMLLGQSTTSRKSTVINAVDEFIADLFPGDIYLTNPCPRLDDDWSPQSLIEMLDTDAGSQKWLCVDEAARLLADFERTYMSGVKDFLCKIYDGVDHKRQLRTGKRKDAKTEFHVKKPYLPLIAATTPDAFAAHVNPLDLKTGWLVRFLFVHPRGRKAFMPIGEYVPPSGEMEVLINRFRGLNDVLSGFSVDAPLRLRLSPEAITVFANWQRGIEKLLSDAGDETIASAYGRLIVYSMKLAGIYTLADADLNPLHGVLEIPVSHIETAIEQIDGYFLPMFVDTAELVERNHTQNLQTAILGYLREAGGTLTQRDILRKTRVKVRDLSEAISALAVSGDVKVSKPDVKGTVTVRLV